MNNPALLDRATTNPALERSPRKLELSCLILCGGQSKRMGRPKAFLPYNGMTLIENMLDKMSEIFSEVLLVSNNSDEFEHLSADCVRDIVPRRGPLVGILSGMLVARKEKCFVIPCDMPFIDADTVNKIVEQEQTAPVVIYSCGAHIEPLLGVYDSALVSEIEDAIFDGRDGILDFLDSTAYRTVQFPEKRGQLPVHFNIDTPSDYSRVCVL